MRRDYVPSLPPGNRQLGAQAAAFEKEGGFTERLYRARSQLHPR